MNYSDINQARIQAVSDIEKADIAITQAARLIKGRLRAAKVSSWVLDDLKRELKDYNMVTGLWRDS